MDLELNIQNLLLKDPPFGRMRDNTLLLQQLESGRNKLLLVEEARWRQHNRATWIKGGDLNMKFFHQYASSRQNKKHIWDIQDDSGATHRGQPALKTTATTYYKFFYTTPTHSHLQDSISVANIFPRFVTTDESNSLNYPCTLQEIHVALLSFNKDKSPGPDGWTVEFFIQFFDLVVSDLLELVEDSKLHDKITGALNSTFLTFILKETNPSTFGDYRPIALCNLCYRLITKTIANRIKPILLRALCGEHLGFLKGRQILDTIGTTHECLHSIKTKKSKALILKLDLKKAFDCLDWDFLRLILIKSGFSLDSIKWIMCGVTTANFSVLVNGEPSSFFRSGRGLRQGCPLSPLLFILVMEGLSLLLKESQSEGKITGIKVSRFTKVLHLLFADDVLIMTNGSLHEWTDITDLLKTFCNASGLLINWNKSTFHHVNLSSGP